MPVSEIIMDKSARYAVLCLLPHKRGVFPDLIVIFWKFRTFWKSMFGGKSGQSGVSPPEIWNKEYSLIRRNFGSVANPCYLMLAYPEYIIYYVILYYIVSYYIILYYIMLYYIILYYIILYYIILYYIILYYIILYYIVFYFILLYHTCLSKSDQPQLLLTASTMLRTQDF